MRSDFYKRLNVDVDYLRTRPENKEELYPWVVKNLEVMKILLRYIMKHDYVDCDGSPSSCRGHLLAEYIRDQPAYRIWAWRVLNMNCKREARILLGMSELDLKDVPEKRDN